MKIEIEKMWLDDKSVNIQLYDGTVGREYFADYPRLAHATVKQRENFRLSVSGIHWAELDEDLSYEGFFKKPLLPEFAQKLRNISGLNMSQLARRVGISQSLFAAYLCGRKKPSPKRLKEIETALHNLGRELCAVQF